MSKYIVATAATLSIMALFAMAIHDAANTKTVTLSYAKWVEHDYLTDQHASDEELARVSCVNVEPSGSCNAMPRKYYIVWGE